MHWCFDDEKTKQLDRHFCTRNRLDAMVMLIDGSKFAEVYYFKAGVEMFLDCLPVSSERQDIFYLCRSPSNLNKTFLALIGFLFSFLMITKLDCDQLTINLIKLTTLNLSHTEDLLLCWKISTV